MKTTLNQIRDCNPCRKGWTRLLTHLGKTKADDKSLAILTVLESNGLDDALWCLQTVKDKDKEIRLYAVWCARQIQHLMTDVRSTNALDVAEKYANGEATDSEVKSAWDEAREVTRHFAQFVAGEFNPLYITASIPRVMILSISNGVAWQIARDASWCIAKVTGDDVEVARALQETELIRICQ